MPQLLPQRPMVSYSGPSHTWPANRWTCRQATGHWVQARTPIFLAVRACESTRSTPAKEPLRKLLVGRAPPASTASTMAGVPSSIAHQLSSVSTRSLVTRSMSRWNCRASPTVTDPVPRTTTALTFLAPITAPAPPRPAL